MYVRDALSRNRDTIEDMMGPIKKEHQSSQPNMKLQDALNEDSGDDDY